MNKNTPSVEINKFSFNQLIYPAVFCYTLLVTSNLFSQDSVKHHPLTVSGYVEAYFCYDLSKPSSHERPVFVYNHKRTQEVSINLAYLKLNYTTEMVRANLAMMGGTYAQYNLSAEQGLLRNLFEANAGLKLLKNHRLWLDAGIFPSHLGIESAIGKDCYNLTRSLSAENSPYYEAGVNLNYTTSNQKLYLALLYLNGWQRIQRASRNNAPNFGTQLMFKPSTKFSFNWSTFIGSDSPDSLLKWRFFNNLYCQWNITPKLGVIAGFDFGIQQQSKHSADYYEWYSPIIHMRYALHSKLNIAARAEFYADKNQVIVYTGTKNGFQTQGYSINLDYLPVSNLLLRVEAKTFVSKDEIFELNQQPNASNYCFAAALAFSF